jgi:hypothetical protein
MSKLRSNQKSLEIGVILMNKVEACLENNKNEINLSDSNFGDQDMNLVVQVLQKEPHSIYSIDLSSLK